MNDLVFLDPNRLDAIPFTTSKVIAEVTGMNHRRVKDAIRKHESTFLEFGLLGAYETESSGGRPEEIVKLNEEQATFLMTLLKNTPTVVAFKKELVRQFYAMRRELVSRQVNRAKMLPTRRDLTDAIRDCIPESPHKGMWYKHYTDLAYRAAFGMSAAQLRKARNAPKGSVAADYLTAEEMDNVVRITKQIGVLVEMRMDYQQIKRMLLQQRLAAS
ncbi:Rha family transcriptional regulator [Intestinimonas butyriciproducens]|uniref:Phage regulator Rha-like protein n=1 Tax=Intestinimonas butyriciproducens TaxID=1297617 RepID=A0A2U1BFF4_9FIRM|nr:Rha family transcriptional regulator [Intestinimonas butyriciproducens]MBU5230017.1 Rha family transcriptional regulator [Intestinimonas butyriciproducens]MCR1907363.1 Rha family transcriptional regulator [Intestinimonas butyriciproducens]MDB7830835.1 Rha family transcriptional regulator [Intestinimonas butyriciproducens]PVY47327.1 phage regulator Rha-like protein [Intestinimonas butyriciproducens]